MSLDYGNTHYRYGNVPQSTVANGTVKVGQYIFSKSFNIKALHAQVRLNTATILPTQSFRVQASDSAGLAGGTWTDVLTITMSSGSVAGTQYEHRATSSAAEITANGLRCFRMVHVAVSTDATVDYDYEVAFTEIHC